MKKILLQIIILVLFCSCSQNEKKDFDYGNLWSIESKSGTESFIFGTLHMYPSNEIELSKTAVSKLKICKVLALERDLTNQIKEQKIAEIKTPNSLSEFINAINTEYGDELKNMEGELIKISKKSNIDLIGLDAPDEILGILRQNSELNMPERKISAKQRLKEYQLMLNLYEKEFIQRLYEEMKIQSGNKVTKSLVDDRNENWMDDIESLIENHRTFIAVGVGHLAGENGILNLLRKKGYKLERLSAENTMSNNVYKK